VSVFQQLVTSMAQPMYRLAARIVGNTADAQDVLQESMLRAFGALRAEKFEGRSAMRTWLYRIVTNTALDHLRARQRRQRWQLSVEAEGVTTGDSVEALAALRELHQWLSHLPPDQRAAIVLKEIEGMTSAEVAAVLGCTEGAVEQKLVRARATLRERNQYD
jgi:RNA polymerase sigma-70 factor, ECF subfamily